MFPEVNVITEGAGVLEELGILGDVAVGSLGMSTLWFLLCQKVLFL